MYPILFARDKIICLYYSCETEKFLWEQICTDITVTGNRVCCEIWEYEYIFKTHAFHNTEHMWTMAKVKALCMLHSSYKWKQKIVAHDKKLQWILQCLLLPRKITPDSSIYSTLLFYLIIDTIPTIKPTNALMLKINFLHTICHNCDMFQPILIIRRVT